MHFLCFLLIFCHFVLIYIVAKKIVKKIGMQFEGENVEVFTCKNSEKGATF